MAENGFFANNLYKRLPWSVSHLKELTKILSKIANSNDLLKTKFAN